MIKVLKFYANWCSPCTLMTAQLDKLQPHLTNVEVNSINIDENTEMIKKYNVRSIPTLIRLDESDDEFLRITGSTTDAQIISFVA